jgi:hypothetical protein
VARIRLIHWKAAEAAEYVDILRNAGHQVDYEEKLNPGSIRDGRPEAVLIDLSRMPSHGREVGVHLRGAKSTRYVPLVFVGGDPEKVAAIRAVLPDATYTKWSGVLSAVRKALSHAPAEPVVPPQMMDRYSSRPVAQKLGIAAGSVVTVLDPPRNFPGLLGGLPDGVTFLENERSPGAVTLWFIDNADSYRSAIGKRRSIAGRSRFWILWPKGEAGKKAGITQNLVRETAIAVGLVDYKICAVNETWSAILFAKGKGD